MNFSDTARPWRCRYLVLWGSKDATLLSIKVGIRVRGKQDLATVWREQLAFAGSPTLPWESSVSIEAAHGTVPPELQNPPGLFYSFEGQTPLSWQALLPPRALPTGWNAGPVAVRWTGTLYGLLLIGEESLGGAEGWRRSRGDDD